MAFSALQEADSRLKGGAKDVRAIMEFLVWRLSGDAKRQQPSSLSQKMKTCGQRIALPDKIRLKVNFT